MKEIVPGIFTWPWFSERHGYDFNGYFVRDAAGNLVIDPVSVPNDVLARFVAEGVSRVVLTNRNHGRDAARVREVTGARISIHAADKAHAESQGTTIDDALSVGERVGPFEVVAADGKSPGEVALYDPSRRLLVVGDAFVGAPPGGLRLLPDAVLDDVAALRRSIRRLVAGLDIDCVLPCDGAPILRGASAALDQLVAGFPSEG